MVSFKGKIVTSSIGVKVILLISIFYFFKLELHDLTFKKYLRILKFKLT